MSIEERPKIDITYHLFACNSIGEVATGTFPAVDAKSAIEEVMEYVVPELIRGLEEWPAGIFSLIIDASEAEHAGGLLIYSSDRLLPIGVICNRCNMRLGVLDNYGAELKCPKCGLVHVIYEEKEPDGDI